MHFLVAINQLSRSQMIIENVRLSIPELKLLIGLPAVLITLLFCGSFLLYARSKGWSAERTKRVGFWGASILLYGGIAIGLALLWFSKN
jgi:hypothetical protein